MANKQPWYHEVQILFTSTNGKPLGRKEIQGIMNVITLRACLVKDSIEIIESEPEPGDPADLM